MLAPIAEVQLQLAAAPGILETDRLAALGLVLRALLCMEVRQPRLIHSRHLPEAPAHIVHGTTAAHVVIKTASGVTVPIVVGAPPQVSIELVHGC